MDILFDIFIDIYVELMGLIFPKNKRSKRQYILAGIVAFVLIFGILALGLWGGYLVFKDGKSIGWIPLGIAIVLSIIQITCGILLYIKKKKAEKVE